jgi:hypothetical protein
MVKLITARVGVGVGYGVGVGVGVGCGGVVALAVLEGPLLPAELTARTL